MTTLSATSMTHSKAMGIYRHGGPEVLELIELKLPAPAPHEVRVRHTAIGLNYSDINVRKGGFYLGGGPSLPVVLGNEAAVLLNRLVRKSPISDLATGLVMPASAECFSTTRELIQSAGMCPPHTW